MLSTKVYWVYLLWMTATTFTVAKMPRPLPPQSKRITFTLHRNSPKLFG